MEKFIVDKDGIVKNRFCPFQTGVYAQDNFQRTVYMNQNCSTRCAHFEIREENEAYLTCASTLKILTIQTEEEIKLINLKS